MTIKGALRGGTLKPVNRYGDLQNAISIGTAAAYASKKLFKEHSPYYVCKDTDGIVYIVPTHHFITELRKHLSGEVPTAESMFSPSEADFYGKYIEWVDGVSSFTGEELLAIEALDKWLVDEVSKVTHPELTREYEEGHPWVKPPEEEEI